MTHTASPAAALKRIAQLERRNRLDEAVDALQRLLAAHPGEARAWEKVGDIAVAQGKLEAASRAYAHALTLEPKHFAAAYGLARTLAAMGNLHAAGLALDQAEALSPRDPRLFSLRGEILITQRRWPALADAMRNWSAIAPKEPQAWRYLAAAYFELEAYAEAAKAAACLVALSPGDAGVLTAYGQLCLQANDYDAAAAAFAKAEALAPDLPEMLAGKARLLTFEGRLEDAKSYASRAIARDPLRAEAYWTLALANRGRFNEGEFSALTRLAANTQCGEQARAMANFALGHAQEARGDAGDAGDAFAAFATAHLLKLAQAQREGLRYDPPATERRFAQLIAHFGPAPAGRCESAPRPVFIVGMPRSGTSLIEGVLGAHSRVLAGGERAQMPKILAAYLTALAEGTAPGTAPREALAKRYFDGLPALGTKDVLTDKFPLNLEAAGLIAQLFPQAVIIYAERDAVETALSIWRHEFSKYWRFAHRFEDIAHYMGQAARLAAHWRAVLGPRFVTIHHEIFAAHFADEAPKLIAACGLEWEAACAQFQASPTRMATLSAAQVRQAVAPATPRAPFYGERLKPLREALAKAGLA